MKSRSNVTLTLDDHVLKRARHLAVERGVSLSKLLADQLEAFVVREDRYEAGRKRLLARMRRGFDLGLRDRKGRWTRDDRYER
ncbi:MAG TPA: DUF6364 family protein [Thermoanaerobaculia bacterium]|nr:DUF6364 family protein [Thermoanaerobaculia bacterium]